jgi:hypothetical protein
VIAARDQRRLEELTVLVGRLPEGTSPEAVQAVRTLHALSGFETFDALGDPDRALADVLPQVTALAETALARVRAAA